MPDDDPRKAGSTSIPCGSCVHYYVTWDPGFPHGCRAMGFKCKGSPSLRVRETSGLECQLYVRKELKEQ